MRRWPGNVLRTLSDPWATLPFAGLPPPITEPVPDWPPGLTRYRPLHALGSGGMGVVYLCHDTLLDRQVALKFARGGGGGGSVSPAAATAALAEARAAARLHHPGICPLFEAGVSDGVPYLTMGFVQGPTLAAELKRLGPCPPPYAARMLRAVAEAMQYAHDHGVIHRDLKPGNILLTADHQPIVTDFGLAVRLDHDEPADGVITGTPHYMAPEQWAGDAAAITERTDVFALGVILFEMLTGRVPFDGTAHQVREKVLNEPVPPVTALRPDVPPELARIVATATARDPADRFVGMAAFAESLTNSLRSLAPRPRVVIPNKVVLKAFGFAALLTAGVFGLIVLSGLVFGAFQKVRHMPSPATADPARDDKVAALAREAKELVTVGEIGRGLEKYDAALELDPKAIAPREARAQLYEWMGRFEDALADFDTLIGLGPTDLSYRKGRAEVLLKLNRPAEVVDEMTALLRTQGRDPELHTLRGAARVAMGEYRAAMHDLDQAIELHATNARGYYLRSLAKRALGDETGAAADEKRMSELEAGK